MPGSGWHPGRTSVPVGTSSEDLPLTGAFAVTGERRELRSSERSFASAVDVTAVDAKPRISAGVAVPRS